MEEYSYTHVELQQLTTCFFIANVTGYDSNGACIDSVRTNWGWQKSSVNLQAPRECGGAESGERCTSEPLRF